METVTTTQTTPSETVAPVVAVVNQQPPHIISVSGKTLDSADRRRDWALWIITGGGISMTLYAIAVLYIVQATQKYAYYLGLSAMVNIFVLFGAIAGLLVKRTVNVSRNGLIMEDHDNNKSG